MDRPGFFFCICPDHGLTRAHIEEKLLSRSPEEKARVFWGDEGLDARFWNALNLVSLDSSFHVLILRQSRPESFGFIIPCPRAMRNDAVVNLLFCWCL